MTIEEHRLEEEQLKQLGILETLVMEDLKKKAVKNVLPPKRW